MNVLRKTLPHALTWLGAAAVALALSVVSDPAGNPGPLLPGAPASSEG